MAMLIQFQVCYCMVPLTTDDPLASLVVDGYYSSHGLLLHDDIIHKML